jgi:hypothetical protein
MTFPTGMVTIKGVEYIGLVAEAHLVNFLESMGYRVDLLYDHNVEIRRISGVTWTISVWGSMERSWRICLPVLGQC